LPADDQAFHDDGDSDEESGMTTDAKNEPAQIREAAMAKLRRLQQSPRYCSFCSRQAIDEFVKVKPSALAGKSLPHNKRGDSLGKG
jgi:hypothetical protein